MMRLILSVYFQVLVFSQSLLSLDLIEEFLARASDQTISDSVAGQFGTWIPGKDYYRFDASYILRVCGLPVRPRWIGGNAFIFWTLRYGTHEVPVLSSFLDNSCYKTGIQISSQMKEFEQKFLVRRPAMTAALQIFFYFILIWLSLHSPKLYPFRNPCSPTGHLYFFTYSTLKLTVVAEVWSGYRYRKNQNSILKI